MSSDSSLGSYLRRRRERSGLSVEAVSTGSRIVPRLVEALEADRHALLAAAAYVRGVIRADCDQVVLGDAGGVELALDGHALPALGTPGQVVRDATVPGGPRP